MNNTNLHSVHDMQWEFPHLLKKIAQYDHSISVPSLGNLFQYDRDSPIGKAQESIAKIYGAPFMYPSTNGTTPLNVMALLSITSPGDKVLVQRDSHVSVLASIIHAGLKPVYVSPRYSDKLGITMGVTAEELIDALTKHPDIKAVFLTYPNYFGVATDIQALVDVVAQKNIPLVVDSAHGSHWVFCNEFPMRAETAGAQIVTYSTHKTCTVLGQGSLMIINDTAIVPRLYEIANSCGFVSTSFSYVILSALFYGIGLLAEDDGRQFSESIALANWARNEINKIDGLRSFGIEDGQPGFVDFDPLRLTVDVSGIGYSGYEVEDLLIAKYGFYPEMGTLQNVLFLITAGIGREDIRLLVERLRVIAANPKPLKQLPKIQRPELPIQAYTPRDAFYFTRRRDIPVYESIGCISAETISAYPPGSAVIVAGEVITQEVVDYLSLIHQFGGHLKGAGDTSFQKIKVLDI